MPVIKKLFAREVLDSRGTPTLEVTAVLDDGSIGVAGVPSGASNGVHEALELRDGDRHRYNGMGVLNAMVNVNGLLENGLNGIDAMKQPAIDQRMIQMDDTPNKSKFGANAIVGASVAIAKAAAASQCISLYQHLKQVYGLSPVTKLPVPLANLFNGGRHASTNLDLQEIWVVPRGISSTADQIRATAEIDTKLKGVLVRRGMDTDIGDEGGFSPRVETSQQPFELVSEAVDEAGYSLGDEVVLGVDAAASTFYDAAHGNYHLTVEQRSLSRDEMINFFVNLVQRYMIRLLEDPFSEDDWASWQALCAHPALSNIAIIGDDLFTTSAARLQQGIDMRAANGIIIKPNQIGTITESIQTALLAQKNNYLVVVSHRSGETNDDWIIDLGVALNADHLKIGAPVRGERVAKYNRLLQIAAQLSL